MLLNLSWMNTIIKKRAAICLTIYPKSAIIKIKKRGKNLGFLLAKMKNNTKNVLFRASRFYRIIRKKLNERETKMNKDNTNFTKFIK